LKTNRQLHVVLPPRTLIGRVFQLKRASIHTPLISHFILQIHLTHALLAGTLGI